MRNYKPEIDGLRAVAVGMVIAFHAFPSLVPGGFIGVDVFFVLSGYLISAILLNRMIVGKFGILDFYSRRIRRIFPPLIPVLVFVGIYGAVFLLPGPLKQIGKHIAASTVFVPNFVFWSEAGYFDSLALTKPLLHLWSLGVEEQFYLFWPFALFLCLRRKIPVVPVIAGLLLASFALNAAIVHSHPESAFYLPMPRAWELMVGALLVRFDRLPRGPRTRLALSLAGALLIALPALLLTEHDPFPGWWALFPTLGAAFIIAAGSDSFVGRILQTRPLPQIGRISYALYLWHWPLLSIAATSGSKASLDHRILAVAAASLLAAISYFAIERPIRRTRSKVTVGTLVVIMAAVGCGGLLVFLEDGLPQRFPAEIQKVLSYEHYDYGKDARLHACWLLNDANFASYSSRCFLDRKKTLEPAASGIVVWGDSHAARLYPGSPGNARCSKRLGADYPQRLSGDLRLWESGLPVEQLEDPALYRNDEARYGRAFQCLAELRSTMGQGIRRP